MTEQEQFTNKFRRECETDYFRSKVGSVISDQLFVNNLLNRINLPAETKKVVTPLIEKKFDRFATRHLPNLVSNQIAIQLPYFLNSNPQMQEILHKHRSDLEQKLESKSREIMDKVVEEEKYQTLSNLHFKKIDERFDSKLGIYDKQVKSTLKGVGSLREDIDGIGFLTACNSFAIVGAAIAVVYFSNKK